MRFATRVLLLQIATVVVVVAVSAVVFLLVGVQQLRDEAENAAVNIARTIAADPEVRTSVAAYSADPGTPDAVALRSGSLQSYAQDITARTGTLFVVITDDHGIRLAHPDPGLLGQQVSTDYREVLGGREVVTWERGTLGVSARAKVPIYPPGAAPTGPAIGEVSVGFEPASVFDDLPTLLLAVTGVAALGVAVGVGAALLLRRTWERMTLGLQPEDLVRLLQTQSAVLDGVGDGVVAVDPNGIVRVCNRTAAELLGLTGAADGPLGRPLDALGLPPLVVDAVRNGTARDGVVVAGNVLYVDSRPATQGGRAIGDVLIVRDRTALVALTERLESVRTMTGALRVQRHEFANRLHVASGLLGADRTEEARAFLAEQLARGPVDFPVEHLDLLTDAVLQAVVGAKAIEAGERGVSLSVAPDSLLWQRVADPEDVAAVLGNLMDNAITAAAAGQEPRTVVVGCYGDGTALVLTVADSGAGIAPDDPFGADPGRADSDRIHGWGIGLRLSRELARRRGGDLWIIDRGGVGGGGDDDPAPPAHPHSADGGLGGAVFGARLEGVLDDDDLHRESS
ncbi:sensor histidine kinase [Microbacterium flavum]|uniref:sensor histidine kinase n=1 Tax=Microbacterium flavum TaxID=415216 RepID=UPI0027E0DDBB|nr:sensor histidine kinase [Microbacterium flavum]